MVAAQRQKVLSVKVFTEGGTRNDKNSSIALREGFSKLVRKAAPELNQPRFVRCASRGEAFRDFSRAVAAAEAGVLYILLVDSEDPVSGTDFSINSPDAWHHLAARKGDGWQRPDIAGNDQVALMTTCMEAWIHADRDTLNRFFGKNFKDSALLPDTDHEKRDRKKLLKALEIASKDCSKSYGKGDTAFDLLKELDPVVLNRKLPQFVRFISILRHHCGTR